MLTKTVSGHHFITFKIKYVQKVLPNCTNFISSLELT